MLDLIGSQYKNVKWFEEMFLKEEKIITKHMKRQPLWKAVKWKPKHDLFFFPYTKLAKNRINFKRWWSCETTFRTTTLEKKFDIIFWNGRFAYSGAHVSRPELLRLECACESQGSG